jgi:hypothetical protein
LCGLDTGESTPRAALLTLGFGALLLGLGAFLRFYRLDLMLYDFDEGVASIYALQLIEKADLPLFGVRTSLGFYNPPLFIYLIAPAFLVSKSPVVATGMLQLIFVACAGWLGWLLYRRGWRWGVVWFFLFAMLSPGPLFLMRRLWGHALIPSFSCATFALMVLLVRKPQRRVAWFLLPILISFAQQVHFSGALLLIDVAIACAVLRLWPRWRWLLAGAVAAALTYTPWLLHEARTQWADFNIIAATIAGKASVNVDHSQLWSAAIFSLSDFGNTIGFDNYAAWLRVHVPGFQFARAVLIVAMVIALAATVVRLLRNGRDIGTKDNEVTLLALVWIVVPLVVFAILRVVIVPAYWLVALPGPWILVGVATEQPGPHLYSKHGAASLAPLVMILLGGSFTWFDLTYPLAADQMTGLVSPTYRDQRDAVAFVCDHSRGAPAQLVQNNGTDRVDFQILYLIAMLEGNATRLRHSDVEAREMPTYVLNRADRAAPADYPVLPMRTFGRVQVYYRTAGMH